MMRTLLGTLVALLLPLAGCTQQEADMGTLKVLISAPDGVHVDALDVRVFDDGGLLRQQHISKPTLPGGLHLSALPGSGRLRVIIAGSDTTGTTTFLAGGVATLPLTATQLSLALSAALADGDGDGLPDEFDDCPLTADPDQHSAAGFGHGPGDACISQQQEMPSPPPPDMAMNSVPVPGGASKCPGAYLICDEMSALRGSNESFLGTEAVFDNAQVFRGDKSLHLTDNDHLVIQTALPKPDIYMRVFVYLPSPMPSNAITLLRVQQSEGSYLATELQLVGGKLRTRASRIEALQTSNVAPPLDRWFCVQWQVHVDTAGYAATSIDGKLVPGLDPDTKFDTTNSPEYQWVVNAMDPVDKNGEHPATDIWFDELAVDYKPIGCND
jgi:hypothetical protein